MDAQGIQPQSLDLGLVYRRTSTNRQDNSLEVQETLPVDYCKRMQFELIKILEDPDVSTSVPFKKRDGGRELLQLINLWRVHRPEARLHVVVTKQDRLGRDTVDTISTIRQLWESKVTPHFVLESGPMPRTRENEAMIGMKATFAQYERDTIRDRIRITLAHRRSLGYSTCGPCYGFDKQLTNEVKVTQAGPKPVYRKIDNPYEQQWIRQMFAWQKEGYSYKLIADELNKVGVPKKLGGKKWLPTNVWRGMNSRSTKDWLAKQPPADQPEKAA
jgi:DNA invertase Pin-like site-specific DNA recombinase